MLATARIMAGQQACTGYMMATAGTDTYCQGHVWQPVVHDSRQTTQAVACTELCMHNPLCLLQHTSFA